MTTLLTLPAIFIVSGFLGMAFMKRAYRIKVKNDAIYDEESLRRKGK